MLGVVFPGQGSQKLGMLREWYAASACVRQTFEEASDAVQFNVWALTEDAEKINQTIYAQPLLLTASVALWRELVMQIQLPHIACMAGHSLGEYSALVAAEVISLADAVSVVYRRGQLMQHAVPEGQGAMAVVLGLSDEAVIAGCDTVMQAERQQGNTCVVSAANKNAPNQVVIAGHAVGVQAAMAYFQTLGAKAMLLPVSVPSHCALMQPAAVELETVLQTITFHTPITSILHNVTAMPLNVEQIAPADLKQQWVHMLSAQLYSPVRWSETMTAMYARGVTQVIECGYGAVLTGLQKRIDASVTMYGTDTPEKIDMVGRSLGRLPDKLPA